MQNVYSEIATALGQVQAESVNNAGNQSAGTIQIEGQAPVPAFVGVFEQKQVLREDGGGFIPMLMCEVQVSKEYVGNVTLRTGWKITVTPPLGSSRVCKLIAWRDKFSFWELTLEDISQG